MSADGRVQVLSVREAFADSCRYRIPIYQRAYAWGKDEIEALLSDVRDYLARCDRGNYYIGTLVVHRTRIAGWEHRVDEVVDGQQRLTTLFLILAHPEARRLLGPACPVLSAEQLTFEGRSKSSEDLRQIASADRPDSDLQLQDPGLNDAYAIIGAQLRREHAAEMLSYLLEHVKIVRSELPSSTDLNHYFEIMNSRGEQLESHEIVKARLLGHLTDSIDRDAFTEVWDACADFTRYLPASFRRAVRDQLFDHRWSELAVRDFTTLSANLPRCDAASPAEALPLDLDKILGQAVPNAPNASSQGSDEDETGRYGSIIDFPNFLLHVLRYDQWSIGQPAVEGGEAELIPLDDKQLVERFDLIRGEADTKRFCFALLRLRHLFDTYVIKTDRLRDNSEDDSNWVLRRAVMTGEGRDQRISVRDTFGGDLDTDEDLASRGVHRHILMLQSMFQVTDSRRAYKAFLYEILKWLAERRKVEAGAFQTFLSDLARRRYLLLTGEELDCGTNVPHFVFNYLDYLLWADPGQDLAISYRFRYRHSVEHFYPVAAERDPLSVEVVNQFGNLCLMARDENSRRSNLQPEAKVKQYPSANQSLKFQLMTRLTQTRGWAESEIEVHGKAMKQLLSEAGAGFTDMHAAGD